MVKNCGSSGGGTCGHNGGYGDDDKSDDHGESVG